MSERFCICGFYSSYPGQYMEHLKTHPQHYGVDKTRWKKIIESTATNIPPA